MTGELVYSSWLLTYYNLFTSNGTFGMMSFGKINLKLSIPRNKGNVNTEFLNFLDLFR